MLGQDGYLTPDKQGKAGFASASEEDLLLAAADPNLKCSVCHQLFCNPMRTPCGHVFCSGCLLAWLPSSSSCPECRGPVEASALSPDRLADRLVSNLQSFCQMRSAGCTWFGRRGDASKHLASDCACVPIFCPHEGCGTAVARRDMAAHLASCPAGAAARAGRSGPGSAPTAPQEEECPYGCGTRRPPGEALERHKQYECTFEPRKLMAAVSHLASENERLTRENELLRQGGAGSAAAGSLGVADAAPAADAFEDAAPRRNRVSRKSARRSLGPGLSVE